MYKWHNQKKLSLHQKYQPNWPQVTPTNTNPVSMKTECFITKHTKLEIFFKIPPQKER